MRNTIITFFIIACFISCNTDYKKNDKKEERISDTIKKQYYDLSNKNLKMVLLQDSLLKKFYKNGELFSEGKINDNNQRIDEWKFYTKEGELSEIREYWIIKDSLYLNQNIYFADNGEYWNKYKDISFNNYDQPDFSSDTLDYNRTFYAQFDLGKDTIKINEPWLAVCYYYTPIFRNQNSESVVVLAKSPSSFKNDFSNILEVKKDTFFSLRKDIENRKNFLDDDIDHTIAFGRWFETSGKKVIRGYLSEFYTKKISSNKIKEIEKLTFFEKEIYVKDTIGNNLSNPGSVN